MPRLTVTTRIIPAGAARGYLYGVTATSARSAWAVGTSYAGKTLVVRWNGRPASPTAGP
jgi:hypothetical protein